MTRTILICIGLLIATPAKAPYTEECAPVFARLEESTYAVITASREAIFFDLEDVKLSYRNMICGDGFLYVAP